MKITDHLTDKQKLKLKDIAVNKRKRKERLKQKDLEELMGMNRDRYTRKNGAVRRK